MLSLTNLTEKLLSRVREVAPRLKGWEACRFFSSRAGPCVPALFKVWVSDSVEQREPARRPASTEDLQLGRGAYFHAWLPLVYRLGRR